MTLYTLALFLHICGALTLGAINALLLIGLMGVRRASNVEETRLWSGLAERTGRVIPLTALLLVVPGVYLVFAAWGWTTPWIDTALGAVVVLGLLARGILETRLAALHAEALRAAIGSIPAALHERRTDRTLWIACWLFTILFLGVVFLMTNKPDLTGSLITIAVALVAGAALPIFGRQPAAGSTALRASSAAGASRER